ncbi:hypothetical protein [Streptomyces sp. SID13031]|uniref:hypothetical protein n=1 Tax=Streptomyces sp. SID13031 TaxID=2706046 RepID=UPI0013CB4FE6|nr:hypothetical protein [Streptomyces sp. SID13031]NEA30109.1 hypothetical protein [Streptomyces sp. SID13031]
MTAEAGDLVGGAEVGGKGLVVALPLPELKTIVGVPSPEISAASLWPPTSNLVVAMGMTL